MYVFFLSSWRQSHNRGKAVRNRHLIRFGCKHSETIKRKAGHKTKTSSGHAPSLHLPIALSRSVRIYVSFVSALTLILQFSVSPVFQLSLSHFPSSPCPFTRDIYTAHPSVNDLIFSLKQGTAEGLNLPYNLSHARYICI